MSAISNGKVARVARPVCISIANSYHYDDAVALIREHGLLDSLREAFLYDETRCRMPNLADYCGLFVGHPNLADLEVTYYMDSEDRKGGTRELSKGWLVPWPKTPVGGLSRESRHGIQSVAELVTRLSSQLTELTLNFHGKCAGQGEPAVVYDDTQDFQSLGRAIQKCDRLNSLHLYLVCSNHMDWDLFRPPHLKVFELESEESTPTEEDRKLIAKSLIGVLQNCKSLERLRLPDELDFDAIELSGALENLTHLQHFRFFISDKLNSASYLTSIRAIGHRLKSVDLEVLCDAHGSEGLPDLSVPWVVLSCPHLTRFGLDLRYGHPTQLDLIGHCIFGRGSYSSLDFRLIGFPYILPLMHNTSLTRLRLECVIKNELFADFATILSHNHTLRLLEISTDEESLSEEHKAEPEPRKAFIDAIASKNRSLRILRMHRAAMRGFEEPMADVTANGSWAKMIAQNGSVEMEIFRRASAPSVIREENMRLKAVNVANWIRELDVMACAVVVSCHRVQPVIAGSVFDLIPRILNLAQTCFGDGRFDGARTLPRMESKAADVKCIDRKFRTPFGLFRHPHFDARGSTIEGAEGRKGKRAFAELTWVHQTDRQAEIPLSAGSGGSAGAMMHID
jgi:hypothetical protein